MRFSRPLFIALLLSLCVHLALLVDSNWLPSLKSAPEPPAQLRKLSAQLVAQQVAEAPTAQMSAPPPAADTSSLAPAPIKRHRKRPRPKPTPAPDASAPLAQRDASSPASSPRLASASAPVAASAPHAASPTEETAAGNGKNNGAGQAFPHNIKVRYHATYNNTGLSGELKWKNEGNRYQLELSSKLLVFSMRYTSDGHIGKDGLIPEHFQVWKNGNPQEGAEFDWDNKLMHYGNEKQNQAELVPGTQDILSVAWQFAFVGDRLPSKVWLTTGKKVYQYPVNLAGETRFPQEGGQPVAVVRANAEGNQNEFWLATGLHNLPVRIIRKDDKLNIELSASKIEIDGKTVWAQD